VNESNELTAERVAGLRLWVAYGKAHDEVRAESASISRTQEYYKERAKNWADLLSILLDHEAALPLLEAVEGADQIAIEREFINDDGELMGQGRVILHAALAYKERSQPNE